MGLQGGCLGGFKEGVFLGLGCPSPPGRVSETHLDIRYFLPASKKGKRWVPSSSHCLLPVKIEDAKLNGDGQASSEEATEGIVGDT